MKCPSCGDELTLVIAQNADIIVTVDPETMRIQSAGLAPFDHVDVETGCCRGPVPEALEDGLYDVQYVIETEEVSVVQTAGAR